MHKVETENSIQRLYHFIFYYERDSIDNLRK
jgi:hypothetical protein